MTEVRCVKCNRLLMKVTGYKDVSESLKAEVKCPKCNYLHIYPLEGDRFVQVISQSPFESGGTIRIIA